ncbi:MAG: Gfo/Idh/MocA family oxidoreductase [Nitrospiraceae bacterium]|nr:Gfo/Idh/MocA family oxidoreductase [Nitrospiraceae bacterium]
MSTREDMDRRRFLTQAGRGAALGLGVMAATSAQARYTRKAVKPADPHLPRTGRLLKDGEVIGIGIVGVGGMGGSHLEDIARREREGQLVQLRAISDVYVHRQQYRQKWIKKQNGRDIEAYINYRKLLERDDIQGVIIATPDHWHAQVAIHAMEAGKDVYCQKPVTFTIEESLEVRDTALATGRVFQCGAQGSSDDWWWQARKFIKQGGIGKVLWAQADTSRNSAGGPNDRGGEWNWPINPKASDSRRAGRYYIDWQQWLGPAPKRPFSRPRFFQFRKFWDYSGGIATDLLYHVLAPMTIALDAKAPERATGSGGIFVQHDDREVPDTYMSQLDYPDDYTIVLTGSMANRQGNPVMIRGHRATIRPEGPGIKVTAEDEFKEWFQKEYGAEEIVIPNEPRAGHMDNWLECMRTREKCHLDAETAYRAMAGIKMGVDSYRQDKVIFWDGKRERYVKKHPRPHRDAKEPRPGTPGA